VAKKEETLKVPKDIPLLPVRDIVVFPYMILPLFVARTISINAIDEALAKDRMIFLTTQKDQSEEEPTPDQLYKVGTAALIMRMLKMPDGRIKILVQGVARAKVVEVPQEEPFFRARIQRIEDDKVDSGDLEVEALLRAVKEQMQKITSMGKALLPDIMVVAENLDEPGRLADLLGSNLGLKVADAQEILEIEDPVARLRRVNEQLNKERAAQGDPERARGDRRALHRNGGVRGEDQERRHAGEGSRPGGEAAGASGPHAS